MPPLERRFSGIEESPYSRTINSINTSSGINGAYYMHSKPRDKRKYFDSNKRPGGKTREAETQDQAILSAVSEDSAIASHDSSMDNKKGCHADLVEFMTQFLCIGPPEEAKTRFKQRTKHHTKSMSIKSTSAYRAFNDNIKKKSAPKSNPHEKRVLYPVARYPTQPFDDDELVTKQPRRKKLILNPDIAFLPVIEARDDKNSERGHGQ